MARGSHKAKIMHKYKVIVLHASELYYKCTVSIEKLLTFVYSLMVFHIPCLYVKSPYPLNHCNNCIAWSHLELSNCVRFMTSDRES